VVNVVAKKFFSCIIKKNLKGVIKMTYYKERVRNNTKYLYEIQGYRDKKTGKVKHKERCLGKIDEDGALITRKRKLPAQVVKVRKIITKFKLRVVKKKKKENKKENLNQTAPNLTPVEPVEIVDTSLENVTENENLNS